MVLLLIYFRNFIIPQGSWFAERVSVQRLTQTSIKETIIRWPLNALQWGRVLLLQGQLCLSRLRHSFDILADSFLTTESVFYRC